MTWYTRRSWRARSGSACSSTASRWATRSSSRPAPVSTGQHYAVIPLTGRVQVSAGTHYVQFVSAGGFSNGDDFGSFYGVVTPT